MPGAADWNLNGEKEPALSPATPAVAVKTSVAAAIGAAMLGNARIVDVAVTSSRVPAMV